MAKSSPKRVNPKGVNPPAELSSSLKKPKVKTKLKGSAKNVNKKISKNLRKKTFQGRIKRAIKEYEKAGFKISQEQREALLRKRPKDANKARTAVRKAIAENIGDSAEVTGRWIKKYIYHGKLTDEEFYMMRDTGLLPLDGHWKEGTGIPYNEFFEWAKTQDNAELTSILESIRYKKSKEIYKDIPSFAKTRKKKR